MKVDKSKIDLELITIKTIERLHPYDISKQNDLLDLVYHKGINQDQSLQLLSYYNRSKQNNNYGPDMPNKNHKLALSNALSVRYVMIENNNRK